ncbi:MAG: protein kinase [Gallionella sp.]|nr:protein kinase [Gallionella sp.]
MPVQKIGRFEILRELGQGGQGAVYLAHDSQLDRQVAIKTLRSNKIEHLAHEAHIVSRLQHPNIIALYDSGEHQGTPYLVYAYVEGETLAQLLHENKTLPFVRAAEIACGVLEGLAYAHAQGVSHLDIKPANVMISRSGVPMVMDFGLARASDDQGLDHDPTLSGTPRYMAPEVISGKRIDFMADIYSVGTMLYEMVTGEFAVNGDNLAEVMHSTSHESVAAPSTHNERVDEKLETIILKAIAKNSDERYSSASAMKQALQDYLGETREALSAQSGAHSTLEFLLRRMRSKSDFPALTNIISEINQIVSSESEGSSGLARTILQDFALTSKLLKLVNTASYGQFGGTINTISKAVVILGFETVRNIAMSLILMEFLQNKAQAVQLKDEVVQAIFSGIVAAQLSVGHNIRDAEEVMVCSMFHNLGRMLATYYFFDESQDISRLIEQGESEVQAAIKVLGITYSELGLAVARSWNFPPRLLAGMRKLSAGRVGPSVGDMDYLTVTINLAHELCEIAASTTVQNKHQSLVNLTKRYAGATRITERELSSAIEVGMTELGQRSVILNISTGKSPLLARVRKWCGNSPASEQTKKADEFDEITNLDLAAEEEAADSRPHNAEAILGAGIQDVTASLVSDFNLNDVLQMVLETIYRGIGFNRAIILTRDNKQNAMVAKFGFGHGVEALIPGFRFPLPFVADVFHLSIEKGLDIAIENINAPNIADKIPAWYRTTINAPCFILLPVMLKDKAIGMFYADMLEANSLKVSQHQLSLLRTLRNQAILAIKQKF